MLTADQKAAIKVTIEGYFIDTEVTEERQVLHLIKDLQRLKKQEPLSIFTGKIKPLLREKMEKLDIYIEKIISFEKNEPFEAKPYIETIINDLFNRLTKEPAQIFTLNEIARNNEHYKQLELTRKMPELQAAVDINPFPYSIEDVEDWVKNLKHRKKLIPDVAKLLQMDIIQKAYQAGVPITPILMGYPNEELLSTVKNYHVLIDNEVGALLTKHKFITFKAYEQNTENESSKLKLLSAPVFIELIQSEHLQAADIVTLNNDAVSLAGEILKDPTALTLFKEGVLTLKDLISGSSKRQTNESSFFQDKKEIPVNTSSHLLIQAVTHPDIKPHLTLLTKEIIKDIGLEDAVELGKFLSSPEAKKLNFNKRVTLMVGEMAEFGVPKLKEIADAITHDDHAYELYTLQILNIYKSDTLDSITERIQAFKPYLHRLKVLINDNVIPDKDKIEIERSPPNMIAEFIDFIEQHAELVKSNILSLYKLHGDYADLKQYASDLQTCLPSAIGFIAEHSYLSGQNYLSHQQTKRNGYLTLRSALYTADSDLRILALDAISYPEIQNVLVANESLVLDEIVKIWPDKEKRAALLVALANDAVLAELKLKNGRFYEGNRYSPTIGTGRIARLIEFGRVLSHPDIQPLIEFGVIDTRELLKKNRAFVINDIVITAKFAYLTKIKAAADADSWNNKGFGGFLPPDGIAKLRKALPTISMTAASINAEFDAVKVILASKQTPYVGPGDRDDIVLNFYHDQYQQILKFEVREPGIDPNLSLAKIYIANNEYDRAASLLNKVNIVDTHMASAMFDLADELIYQGTPEKIKLAKDTLNMIIYHQHSIEEKELNELRGMSKRLLANLDKSLDSIRETIKESEYKKSMPNENGPRNRK